MSKDYDYCCPTCLLDYSQLPLFLKQPHCWDIPGRFMGCHETFATKELLAEHRHPVTRGCRWPGNIDDYYRKDNIWHKKEPKPEEDTQDPSRNSSSTRSAERHTTSNGSRDMRYRADRQRGQSSG